MGRLLYFDILLLNVVSGNASLLGLQGSSITARLQSPRAMHNFTARQGNLKLDSIDVLMKHAAQPNGDC